MTEFDLIDYPNPNLMTIDEVLEASNLFYEDMDEKEKDEEKEKLLGISFYYIDFARRYVESDKAQKHSESEIKEFKQNIKRDLPMIDLIMRLKMRKFMRKNKIKGEVDDNMTFFNENIHQHITEYSKN